MSAGATALLTGINIASNYHKRVQIKISLPRAVVLRRLLRCGSRESWAAFVLGLS
jgi:hypothetical protein